MIYRPNFNVKVPESISVVIPHQNRLGELSPCLASIRKHFSGEIIVVDDRSSNSARPICRRFDVKLIELGRSVGGFRKSLSINTGVGESKGCLTYLNDVDCLHPQATLSLLSPLLLQSDNIISPARKIVDARSDTILTAILTGTVSKLRVDSIDTHVHRNMGVNRCISSDWSGAWGYGLFLRKDTFQKIGGFDNRFVGMGAGDTDFVFRAAKYGTRLEFVRDIYVLHGHHPRISDSTNRKRNYDLFFQKHGHKICAPI